MRSLFTALLSASLLTACSGASEQQVEESPQAAHQDDGQPMEHRGEHHGEHAKEHGEHHGEHGPIHQHFGDAASFAERFDAPDRHTWQKPEEVIGLMTIEPGMTVADIGAGTGYFLPYLSEAVGPEGRVLALDIEQGMVDYMQARVEREGLENVEVRLVSFDDPALEAGAVDRVLTVNTWHHIPERAAYAQRVLEGLADGGRFVIVDYTLEAESGPPRHIRLSPEVLLGELEGVLRGGVVEETLPRQYIVELSR